MSFGLNVDRDFGSISFSFDVNESNNLDCINPNRIKSLISKSINSINDRYFRGNKIVTFSLCNDILSIDIMNVESISETEYFRYGFKIAFEYGGDQFIFEVSIVNSRLSVQINISSHMSII